MHSKLLIAGLLLFGTLSCNSDHPVHENRASGIVAEIHDPASKKVLVASHRGDWRNYPENSLPALRTALAFGGAVFRRCGRPLGVSSRLQPFGPSPFCKHLLCKKCQK